MTDENEKQKLNEEILELRKSLNNETRVLVEIISYVKQWAESTEAGYNAISAMEDISLVLGIVDR